jgi:hypothetical protein
MKDDMKAVFGIVEDCRNGEWHWVQPGKFRMAVEPNDQFAYPANDHFSVRVYPPPRHAGEVRKWLHQSHRQRYLPRLNSELAHVLGAARILTNALTE